MSATNSSVSPVPKALHMALPNAAVAASFACACRTPRPRGENDQSGSNYRSNKTKSNFHVSIYEKMNCLCERFILYNDGFGVYVVCKLIASELIASCTKLWTYIRGGMRATKRELMRTLNACAYIYIYICIDLVWPDQLRWFVRQIECHL